MLSFAVVLAVISTLFEAMIAVRSKSLRRMASRRMSVNLGVSLTLSLVLGVLFGAVGVIALTAGLMSTVMSIPVYRFLMWNYDTSKALQLGGNRLRGQARQWRRAVGCRTRTMRLCFARAGNLLFAPIRWSRRMLQWLRSTKRL